MKSITFPARVRRGEGFSPFIFQVDPTPELQEMAKALGDNTKTYDVTLTEAQPGPEMIQAVFSRPSEHSGYEVGFFDPYEHLCFTVRFPKVRSFKELFSTIHTAKGAAPPPKDSAE